MTREKRQALHGFLRSFAISLSNGMLYSPAHRQTVRLASAAHADLLSAMEGEEEISFMVVDEQLIVGGEPVGAGMYVDRFLENEAFWRYRQLLDQIAGHEGGFSADEMKANSACVDILKVAEAIGADPSQRDAAFAGRNRTVWHSLYDQQAGTVEVSFYLGEEGQADGTRLERRSPYLTFALETG